VIVQRLVPSALALRCLLALSQCIQGVRTAELAAILGAPYSSAERALELLIADDLVERTDRRSRLVDSPSAAEAVRFGLSYLPAVDAIEALARANPAVEFCGADSDGVLLVVRRFALPADEDGLVRAVEVLRAFHPDRRIELVGKTELRDRLLDDLSPRRRAQAMRVLAGGVDRSFPDRTRHGDLAATWLGRLHPTLPTPSRRRLRELARRYRLRRILAFGSATRADFRPDSDLDLLVEPLAGHAPGLRARVELIADAEELFGRDVDLLTAPVGRPSLAARIAREAVVLYDAAR
jgi:predicted nucleotidyltransferase